MALTRSQEAATIYDQNLIIFAGPGSGKTSTVVAKAERLLSDADTRLCMTTFTVAGSDEMRERLESSFSKQNKACPKNQFAVGTFHSLILKHYKKHSKQTVKLLSPHQSSTLMLGFMTNLMAEDAKRIKLDVERYRNSMTPNPEVFDAHTLNVVRAYEQKLTDIGSIDLAALMRSCVLQMKAGSIPLFNITHMIGDEMQDADELQLEIMLLHARAGVVCTLVADDDQTIYEWRNALGYEGLFRFQKETSAQTIVLEENFRSHEEIVENAVRLIKFNNPRRIEKKPLAVRGLGGYVEAMASGSLRDECAAVAAMIDDVVPLNATVGILERSNFDVDSISLALAKHSRGDNNPQPIAHVREGAGIWDSRECGAYLDLLCLALNASKQELACTLSCMPITGTARGDLLHSVGDDCSALLAGEQSIPGNIDSASEERIGQLIAFTTAARKSLEVGAIPLVLSSARDFLSAQLMATSNANAKRISFLLDAAESMMCALKGKLSKRLNAIRYLQSKPPESARISCMTIHNSKGLEFDVVFLINCTHKDNAVELLDPAPERRLFYVGMTRAKNALFVSYNGSPTRYISEAGFDRFSTWTSAKANYARRLNVEIRNQANVPVLSNGDSI